MRITYFVKSKLNNITPSRAHLFLPGVSDTPSLFGVSLFNNMAEEIWKDIPGWEGMYQISNMGRVKSLKRRRYYRRNPKLSSPVNEKIMSLNKSKWGYLLISLSRNKIATTLSVHRLVLLTFLGKSNLHIDHINHIKTDNRLENLRYCTRRENSHFAALNRKSKKSKYVGVTFAKKENKWVSVIKINKKSFYIGYFNDEHEAHLAFQKTLKYHLDNPDEKLIIRHRIKEKNKDGMLNFYIEKNTGKGWRSIKKNKKTIYFDTQDIVNNYIEKHKIKITF